jgi:hypothetical protein
MSFNIYENFDLLDAANLMLDTLDTDNISAITLPKDMNVDYNINGKWYSVKTLISTRMKNRISIIKNNYQV